MPAARKVRHATESSLHIMLADDFILTGHTGWKNQLSKQNHVL